MRQLWTPWRLAYILKDKKPAQKCVFCAKITAEDAEEHVLYRGKHCFITLNRYPYNNGHLMVVPYLHTPSLESLDDETSLELMTLVRKTLHILRDSYHPDGFNLGVNEGSIAGAGIAGHVHFHIVPRWSGDVNYMSAVGEVRVIPEMLDDTYKRLKPYYEALTHL